jgi:Neuraminidase (sialidase)
LHNGPKSERELSIYAFDEKTGKFHFYSVTPASERANNGSLDISADGNRWIYFGTDEVGVKTVQYRTTNEYHGPDQVDWWSEVSTDNGKTWIKTAVGKETREKYPQSIPLPLVAHSSLVLA